MSKTLTVAMREFRERVRKRGFVVGTIAVPLLLLVIWLLTGAFEADGGVAEVTITREEPTLTIGFVDQADLIESVPAIIPEGRLREMESVEAASEALERGDIDAYYVIRPDYRETGNIERVTLRSDFGTADREWVTLLLMSNVFSDMSLDELMRLRQPFNAASPVFVNVLGEKQAADPGNMASMMLPFMVAAVIMVPLFTSGSYLFQSLAQEKSSRVMEILLVSLRPRQLLTGKLLGLGALTVVQYVAWVGITLVVLTVVGKSPGQFVAGVNLSLQELVLIVPFALGGFVLYAGLMAGIGALSPNMESSRGWVFIVSLPMMIPIYLWMGITAAPNGPLAVILSLIPFSAPVAMLMRMTTAAVPGWQVGVSIVLLALTGVGLVRLMARLFRVQLLLSGEPLSARRMWSALTARA
ncbi:MAG: ABC transporter permease [Chloroflexi bacterium]|jgi:ABC-2 type transport system permease protein|nr:ABC transporter permease [Chloroflexota bacterium]